MAAGLAQGASCDELGAGRRRLGVLLAARGGLRRLDSPPVPWPERILCCAAGVVRVQASAGSLDSKSASATSSDYTDENGGNDDESSLSSTDASEDETPFSTDPDEDDNSADDGDGVEESVYYNGYRAGVDLVGPSPDAAGDGRGLLEVKSLPSRVGIENEQHESADDEIGHDQRTGETAGRLE